MNKKESILIIGSGLGGLVCGAVLSKEGYKVTILEMNKQIGGNLQAYSRDKHLFDAGVHYVGGLDKGQNLYKIFKYLGIYDDLHMEKLESDAFDKIYFYSDDKTYSFAQGYRNFENELVKDFPEEKEAIHRYCEYIKSICASFPMYNIRTGDFAEKQEYTGISAKEFIASLTSNERLRNVLAGNIMLYAGKSDKTPIHVHALVLNSYIESSYRMLKGGSEIAKLLHRKIMEHGGTVIKHAEVKKLIEKNGRITGAETTDGKVYNADLFISNAHPAKTLELISEDAIRNSYKTRISGLENTVSMFILNMRLKPGMFLHENTNYYCHLQDDVWESTGHTDKTWPLCYVLFFSPKPSDSKYAEGITLMTYMRHDEVSEWAGTRNTVAMPSDRGAGYEAFKRERAEKLITIADKRFPGLRNAIMSYYTSTPLTFRDYMGTSDGSVYGIEKDYNSPFKTIISPRTKIPNLFLTGQNINLHGVLGVTISSLVTSSNLIGLKYLVDQIQKSQDA